MNESVFVKEENDKERCRDLLLLADPSWEMVCRYLGKGIMIVLEKEGRVVGEAVYSLVDEEVCELHNLAVLPDEQGNGYGRMLVEEVADRCEELGRDLMVGTAVLVPGEKTFYERLGFVFSHVVKGFFTENYDPPPVDNGVECTDMTYFRLSVKKSGK